MNYYDELIRLRDAQRADVADAPVVIKGKDLTAETNPQGIMKWYMHPAIPKQALRTLLFYVQEIPPQSRSGRQKQQGGVVYYAMAGHGYTTVDGVRCDWKKGDVIELPVRREGVIFQHFNDSPDETAVLVACEANDLQAVGVDKGSGFEQLDVAPEYRNR